jgi:hypothetical protein
MPTEEKEQVVFQTVESENSLNKLNDVRDNFTRRGESYKEGMLLLIDFLTERDWKQGDKFAGRLNLIKENIQTLYKHYLDELQALGEAVTFEEAESHFAHLLEKYQILLDLHTTLKDRNTLFIAERCAVWLKGRQSFCSSVDLDLNPPLSVVQEEIPYTDKELLFKEYEKIESETPPLWFQCIAPWQQEFIKANWRTLGKKSIPSSLRWLAGPANLSLHRFSMNGEECLTYFRHATQLPIDLVLQNGPDVREEAKRLTELNLASQIKLSLQQQLKGVADTEKPYEVVILTQSLLSPGMAATVKSQHFSDASDNDTLIYEMKEEAVVRFQQALEKPIEHKAFLKQWEFLEFNESDGSLAYKGQPIKISLLSTNRPYNILRRFGRYAEQSQRNDLNVSRLLGSVARYLEDHALPKKAKQLGYRSERVSELLEDLDEEWQRKLLAQLVKNLAACEANKTVSASASQQLIKNIDSLKASGKLSEDTLRLLDALQAFLSIPSGQGAFESDKRHRQSLASALEVIIVNCIGGTPWLACKSGKDRTGVASAGIDAAETFYRQYNKYPRYGDTEADRALYLNSLDEFLNSGHQQKVAAQNAPGAEGLVNRHACLPSDMVFDAQSIRLETQLARLNKPKIKPKVQTEVFDQRIFDKELQEIKTAVLARQEGNLLEDWERGRNGNAIYIQGVSIRELRGGKPFEKEEDVKGFINTHLFSHIEDVNEREEFVKQIPYIFHQGAFPNAFGHLCCELGRQLNESENGPSIIFPAPDFQINFLPVKGGVKIEEINVCRETRKAKDNSAMPDYETKKAEEEGYLYYYQTYSCASIKLRRNNKGEFEFFTEINAVDVDCVGEGEPLRSLFFVKVHSLFKVLVDFFMAVYVLWESLKHKWHPAKEAAVTDIESLASASSADTAGNNSLAVSTNSTAALEFFIVDACFAVMKEVIARLLSPRTELLLTNRSFFGRSRQPAAITGCAAPQPTIGNQRLTIVQ